MDEKLQAFQLWFLQHGGSFGEHVELHYEPSRGFHLRLSQNSTLNPTSCIVSCPHSLTLSCYNTHSFANEFGHDPAGDSDPISSWNLLRFFLVEQYQLKGQSFWHPYICTLPDPFTKFPFNTPLYYDDEDSIFLRGTSLEYSTRKIEQAWRDEHAEGLRRLRQTNLDRYPWDIYKWAATVIASRSFPSNALESSNRLKSTNAAAGSSVLLPGLDLLNHSPTAKVTWHWGEETCSITTDKEIGSGELFNNYAPKSNEELIMGYGFSLFKNASDHCNLALGAMAVARIRDTLHQRPTSPPIEHAPEHDEQPIARVIDNTNAGHFATGVGCVRLTHNYDQQEMRPNHTFSPGFLEQASIAFSNVREYRQGFAHSDTNLLAGPLTRNKLHTTCAIVMILQKQYAELAAKNSDLPTWPSNQRQFHAARYRRGQLYILKSLTNSILDSLRRLAGLDASWPRDKRLIRLEHILKAGPKEFLIDFRAVLHVGFGTRNPEKIRQGMLLDSVFTLWLYGLWLWKMFVPTLEVQLSDRPTLPIRTAIWIDFIRKTYGDESDIGQRWTGIPAGEEGQSLTESCTYIIKAAAAKNPKSVYSGIEPSTDRLLWCLRVIREETFMCPNLEGKIGDENDEIMLFFE
ncbi:MAG: hypothetical protein Q9224_002964 [Gallowayella concinna]